MSLARILVLGAGGCLGRAIASAVASHPALTLVAGHRRRPAAAPYEYRLADATQIPELTVALGGVTHVVNAIGGRPGTLRASAMALCAALRDYPAIRLIHISSMAVYGDQTGLVDEGSPLSASSDYGAAKIDAETEVRRHIAAGGRAVILRPGIVCGPNSAQWTGRLTRLVQARRLGDLGPAGDGYCNHIHESELAEAAIAACLTGEATGGTFNLAAQAPPTWNEYLIDLARAAGATPVARVSPHRLAVESRLVAPALQAARRLTRLGRIPDPIPASLVQLFAQRIRLCPARADAVLAFARRPAAYSRVCGLAAE